MYIKLDLKRVLVYLAAILLMLSNGSMYTHLQGSGHLDAIIKYSFAVVLFVLVLIDKKTVHSDSFMKCVIICLLLFFLSIISGANYKVAIADIILVLIVMLYYINCEKNEKPYLLIAYRDVIYIVALVSLFFWIFGSLIGLLKPTSTLYSTWGTYGTGESYIQTLQNYMYLYFERDQTYIFGQFITCNRSIFVERAFTSFSFSIGWFYELFIENNKSKKRLIVFLLAMISTLSMTGLIVSIATLGVYYIFNGKKHSLVSFLKVALLPIIISLCYISIKYLLEVKFSMGSSGTSRVQDFINGFAAWKKSPIYGFGYGNGSIINSTYHTGFSNSISVVLTQGGLVLALLYLMCFIRGVIKGINHKNINFVLFIGLFFVEFATTAITFLNITIYLLVFISNVSIERRQKSLNCD